MTDPGVVSAPATPARKVESRLGNLRGLPPALGISLLVLCAAFGLPLLDLARFSLQGELFSYIPLVPFVSVYLFATARRDDSAPGGTHRALAGLLLALGLAALAARWLLPAAGTVLARQDSLALTTFAFVALVAGACAFFLDRAALKQAAFPLVFLLFMVPFPVAMEAGIEMFLQHGSAPAAHGMFLIAGTTMYYHDLIFELPGIALRVAPECSGIRSTVVLFMTSLVAGQLFLRSPWKRTILTVAVIPLALVRNGFRIFVLGQLCVHVGPHMIDSAIHHQGGPIFFALSLVPFMALVFFLVRSERRRARPVSPEPTK